MRFFCLYPSGMFLAARDHILQAQWDIVESHEDPPYFILDRNAEGRSLPLGCSTLLFELLSPENSVRVMPSPLSVKVFRELCAVWAKENALRLGQLLSPSQTPSWRVECLRWHGDKTQDFSKPEAARIVSEEIKSACGPLAPVSLEDPKEVIWAWVHSNRVAFGWFDRSVCARQALQVDKGVLGIRSRAGDAESVCVAEVVCRHYKRQVKTSLSPPPLVIFDPMCGVGTTLLTAALIFARHFPNRRVQLIGRDLSSDSIAEAIKNCDALQRGFRVLAGESLSTEGESRLMTPDVSRGDTIDLKEFENRCDIVLVDPPWGHRHGSFNAVRKGLPKWALQWTCALRVHEGVCGCVTICLGLMEHEVFEGTLKKNDSRRSWEVEVVERCQFDNKGFSQCTVFVWTKEAR